MLDISKLGEYGLAGIMIGAIGVALWRSLIYIADKLFDENKGYVSKLIETHIDFVHRSQEGFDVMRQGFEQIDHRLIKIEDGQNKIYDAQSKQMNLFEQLLNHQINQSNGSLKEK